MFDSEGKNIAFSNLLCIYFIQVFIDDKNEKQMHYGLINQRE